MTTQALKLTTLTDLVVDNILKRVPIEGLFALNEAYPVWGSNHVPRALKRCHSLNLLIGDRDKAMYLLVHNYFEVPYANEVEVHSSSCRKEPQADYELNTLSGTHITSSICDWLVDTFPNVKTLRVSVVQPPADFTRREYNHIVSLLSSWNVHTFRMYANYKYNNEVHQFEHILNKIDDIKEEEEQEQIDKNNMDFYAYLVYRANSMSQLTYIINRLNLCSAEGNLCSLKRLTLYFENHNDASFDFGPSSIIKQLEQFQLFSNVIDDLDFLRKDLLEDLLTNGANLKQCGLFFPNMNYTEWLEQEKQTFKLHEKMTHFKLESHWQSLEWIRWFCANNPLLVQLPIRVQVKWHLLAECLVPLAKLTHLEVAVLDINAFGNDLLAKPDITPDKGPQDKVDTETEPSLIVPLSQIQSLDLTIRLVHHSHLKRMNLHVHFPNIQVIHIFVEGIGCGCNSNGKTIEFTYSYRSHSFAPADFQKATVVKKTAHQWNDCIRRMLIPLKKCTKLKVVHFEMDIEKKAPEQAKLFLYKKDWLVGQF